jgi:hypothetical protein
MPQGIKESTGENETISVAEATRQIIKAKPSMLDCLRYDIVNFSALAELIYPEVLAVCKKSKVKLDSIKMSLMRYADELMAEKQTLEQKISTIVAESVLELKNDLVVVIIKQEAIFKKISNLFEFVKKFRFFQLIQGTEVFTILADQTQKKELISMFPETSIVDAIENQSALILISKPDIVKVQGVVAYLTYLMASAGLNITQILSCHTDTIFLVDRKDALKAYDLIEDKIYFLRKLPAQRIPEKRVKNSSDDEETDDIDE